MNWVDTRKIRIFKFSLKLLNAKPSSATCFSATENLPLKLSTTPKCVNVFTVSNCLFALYVNDCEMNFINHNCDPIELKELSLFLIMYADDMVIFSETAEGLQKLC
jgi:hypothetical protein